MAKVRGVTTEGEINATGIGTFKAHLDYRGTVLGVNIFFDGAEIKDKGKFMSLMGDVGEAFWKKLQQQGEQDDRSNSND